MVASYAGKSTVSTTSKSVMRMSRRGLGSMLPIWECEGVGVRGCGSVRV